MRPLTRMADMKKQDMAEAAEQLLAGDRWLPALMRTPRSVQQSTEAPTGGCCYGTNPDAYSVAAE